MPLLAAPEAETRQLALFCLEQSRAPETAARAAALLADPDLQLRHAAVRVLRAAPPEPGLRPALVAMAGRPEAADVRAGVVAVLGKLAAGGCARPV